jgi:hypothetical protein
MQLKAARDRKTKEGLVELASYTLTSRVRVKVKVKVRRKLLMSTIGFSSKGYVGGYDPSER